MQSILVPVDGSRPCERAQRCDQIVMGMRGRGAIARVVLGSVSVKTLQPADAPVTLVK
ncbi:MAG TPA: universal stress protein [Burkholderiales bacterium]|nr:universal stress protein [Burkholderiales bacterium]